jgi:hypothetical protein
MPASTNTTMATCIQIQVGDMRAERTYPRSSAAVAAQCRQISLTNGRAHAADGR